MDHTIIVDTTTSVILLLVSIALLLATVFVVKRGTAIDVENPNSVDVSWWRWRPLTVFSLSYFSTLGVLGLLAIIYTSSSRIALPGIPLVNLCKIWILLVAVSGGHYKLWHTSLIFLAVILSVIIIIFVPDDKFSAKHIIPMTAIADGLLSAHWFLIILTRNKKLERSIKRWILFLGFVTLIHFFGSFATVILLKFSTLYPNLNWGLLVLVTVVEVVGLFAVTCRIEWDPKRNIVKDDQPYLEWTAMWYHWLAISIFYFIIVGVSYYITFVLF